MIFRAEQMHINLFVEFTWKEDNEEFTNTSTIDQLVILKVNPKTEEAHKHKLKKDRSEESECRCGWKYRVLYL